MKIKINYNGIYNLIVKNLYPIGFFAMILFQIYLISYNPESVKFAFKVTGLVFICLILNASFFGIYFILGRKKEYYKYLFYSLLTTNIGLMVLNASTAVFDYLSKLFSSIFLESIIPIRFVQKSVNDGGLFWVIMLFLYISIFLFVYGNWYIRNKKKADGFWKIERQLFFTGLGLYGILIPFIFIFTHFTFVGSNYMDIQWSLKYTDKIVDLYDKKQQKDNFQLVNLRYFNNIKEVKEFYGSTISKSRAYFGDMESKIAFYDRVMNDINNIEQNGIQQIKKTQYDNIEDFPDWVGVSYNLRFRGSSVEQGKFWDAELTNSLKDSGKLEELVRHSLFYLKESKNGGYYAYFSMDRSFKNLQVNYKFNIFFILFHIFYIGFFVYLLKIHQKKNLSKKYIINNQG